MKPFGRKAHAFATRPPYLDAPINILEGAVRSSKTWAMIPKLLALSAYEVEGHRIITGVSKQTIYNNVLNDLFNFLTPKNYNFNHQSGELHIMGTKWLTIGAKDEGSEKYVRGLTVGVWYGDELTLQPVNFIKMCLNRMSPNNARAYATTNPDVPTHFVKTDIIDNPVYIKNGYVWSEHFVLDDNPNLSPERKEFLRNLYKGVYHMRYIDGLWVVAEGGIYKDVWGEDLLYDDVPWVMKDGRPGRVMPQGLRSKGGHAERYVPTDYGTTHPMVFLDMIDDGRDVWVDREYVWDSQQAEGEHIVGRQKTDKQYADDLEKFLKLAPDAQVIIPPEVASFEAELVQRGIWFMIADNDVEDGIRTVSSFMALKRIHVHRRCKRTVKGIENHVWDPKAALRGIEQPLKQRDDEADALRYGIKTKIPAWRLMAA